VLGGIKRYDDDDDDDDYSKSRGLSGYKSIGTWVGGPSRIPRPLLLHFSARRSPFVVCGCCGGLVQTSVVSVRVDSRVVDSHASTRYQVPVDVGDDES
jgi:hypothetical protein